MAYERWTPELDTQLADEVRKCTPNRDIAAKMGRSTKSVIGRKHVLGLVSRDNSDAALWQARRDSALAEVERQGDIHDWLRPVEMAPPPKQEVTQTPAPFTIVGGDFHFGMHDDRATSVFLATVEALRPRRVILNGDTVDLLAVSRYPKDNRRGKTWELRDEVTAFHGFLRQLHTIGDPWGVEVIETSANHSGDGTDGRWWRYLNENVPQLLGHADAEELLSYKTWFLPKWSNIRLEDSVMVADQLLVMHGDMVRSEAAYTAKASREKWMNSVLVNHTHRMGLSPKTITAIQGKPTSYVRGYENGCLCKLEVPYGRALNWQQGFAIICEGDGFGVEQVFIDNGVADIAALGKTLRA